MYYGVVKIMGVVLGLINYTVKWGFRGIESSLYRMLHTDDQNQRNKGGIICAPWRC